MANDAALFQHFLRYLFPHFYGKYPTLELDDGCVEPFVERGPLTQNLFDVFIKTMNVFKDLLTMSWMDLLDNHTQEMTGSAERYVSQVILVCYAQKSNIQDIYERFINVCALVTLIGVHTYCTTGKRFHKLTPQILTVFFENILKEDFKKRGGWKRLEKYIMDQDYLELYEASCSSNDCEGMEGHKDKLLRFITGRKYLTQDFYNTKKLIENFDFSDLTSKVVSSIDSSLLTELNATLSTEMLPNSIWEENFIVDYLYKLSLLKKNRTSEPDQDSGKDNVDSTALREPSLAKHLLNLRRWNNEFTLNTESLSESSNNAIHLITGLRHLRLKLEHAISLLESLEV